jgi:transketolase N-terminal domain/subunit
MISYDCSCIQIDKICFRNSIQKHVKFSVSKYSLVMETVHVYGPITCLDTSTAASYFHRLLMNLLNASEKNRDKLARSKMHTVVIYCAVNHVRFSSV